MNQELGIKIIRQTNIDHNSLFMIHNSCHTPVLLNEVIKILNPKPGEFFIDGTLGGGGHTRAILEKIGPAGKLLAIDWDESILKKSMIHNSRFLIHAGNYADLPEILESKKLGKADGLLLDLGFSSEQLGSGKGFSFSSDEPLIMTYSASSKPVKEVLREISEEALAKLIKDFGEERFAARIARAIKIQEKSRPIATSGELAEVVKRAVPKNYERGRIHPATRTFMALRIYANRELENLESILKNLDSVLKPGGRAAIISFHSLEDRLVKNYFCQYAKEGKVEILTKKPIIASREEILINPRSRSAKLRAATIIP